MAKAAKRIGRPAKTPIKGKRVSLGLKVTAQVKRHIDEAARNSGRTQSQEAEALIEKALTYDRALEAMRTTLTKIKEGSIEAAFRSAGFIPCHSPYGKIWVPKDYPLTGISGLIPPEENQ